jgi:UDP-N-acetylmuramyl pentapeptide phosphotransferase/UDP-N-acetylglucosamine-1-phosphate transferase
LAHGAVILNFCKTKIRALGSTAPFFVKKNYFGHMCFDDILTLSSKLRLPLQLLSTGLMLFAVLGVDAPWWLYGIALIVSTGIINAYNFMDGINGITAAYSAVVLVEPWQ